MTGGSVEGWVTPAVRIWPPGTVAVVVVVTSLIPGMHRWPRVVVFVQALFYSIG